MSVVMKTARWMVRDNYMDGFAVFAPDNNGHNDITACRNCVEDALAGDLEAIVAIEMCWVDEMLMQIWHEQLKEKERCKPKA